MADKLMEGGPAPDFELPGDNGETVSLSALKGRTVVLYFYPKDDTSGCTREALEFTALADAFSEAGATVIGISPDSPVSHGKFREKHDLTVMLASDESRNTLETYGVWVEKSMYGRRYMGVERTTVLVRPDGTVGRIWRKVKVPGHAAEVLEGVRAV